jgi:hypothetical protein
MVNEWNYSIVAQRESGASGVMLPEASTIGGAGSSTESSTEPNAPGGGDGGEWSRT